MIERSEVRFSQSGTFRTTGIVGGIKGPDVKIAIYVIPTAGFLFFLSLVNPIWVLECDNDLYCLNEYPSTNSTTFKNWTYPPQLMQSSGYVNAWEIQHGWVDCGPECESCLSEECIDFRDHLSDKKAKYKDWISSDILIFRDGECDCPKWCHMCDNDLEISLPGNFTLNAGWWEMSCDANPDQMISIKDNEYTDDRICDLFTFYKQMWYLSYGVMLGITLWYLLLLSLEYSNFETCCGGRCMFLLCHYKARKSIHIFFGLICLLGEIAVAVLLFLFTTDNLDVYFSTIHPNVFVYKYISRGFLLMLLSMITLFGAIVALCFSKKVKRFKHKAFRNDIHGISQLSVQARRFR